MFSFGKKMKNEDAKPLSMMIQTKQEKKQFSGSPCNKKVFNRLLDTDNKIVCDNDNYPSLLQSVSNCDPKYQLNKDLGIDSSSWGKLNAKYEGCGNIRVQNVKARDDLFDYYNNNPMGIKERDASIENAQKQKVDLGKEKINLEEEKIDVLRKILGNYITNTSNYEKMPDYQAKNKEFNMLMAKKTEREDMNKNLVSAQQQEQKATLDDIRSRASPYGGKMKKTRKSKKSKKTKKTKKSKKTKKTRKYRRL